MMIKHALRLFSRTDVCTRLHAVNLLFQYHIGHGLRSNRYQDVPRSEPP